MLSRRNVRIKIMQVLYATQRQEQPARHALGHFDRMVRTSFGLYLLNLLILQRVAEYAKVDEATRRAKLRPSAEDKLFRATLATNPSVSYLTDNRALSATYDRYRVRSQVDADQVKALYREFATSEAYQDYLAIHTPNREETTAILLKLYKWLQGQDVFLAMIEDHYPLWEEDKSLVIGAIKKTIKALPAEREEFYRDYEDNGEAVTDFGRRLLQFVTSADEALLTRIKGVLENWDAERVAIVDMILIKMALGEFLEFPSIPPIVTLNEYVDISKLYSTPKSKEFINGVLDKLLKQLQSEGLVGE